MQRFDFARLRRRPKPHVHVNTSSTAFAFWWLSLLVLRNANFAYYVGVAVLYRWLDKSYLNFQIGTYGIGLPVTDHPTVSCIHACIGALHAYFILVMVASSLHARQLVFQSPNFRLLDCIPCLGRLLGPCLRCFRRESTEDDDAQRTPSGRLVSRLSSTGHRVFGRDGLLGADSVYFDHVLLVRELVETALQTNQLYRRTLVLPRLWLIRLYVALLVANWWIMPVLHRFYRDHETTRRMLCLLCDAVLDMLSSIGVSVVIFATYAPQYVDPHGWGFPLMTWFDDTWFSNMQQEFQVMLVATWTDMTSRVVFAVGLVQCMNAIKEMLTPVETMRGPPILHMAVAAIAPVKMDGPSASSKRVGAGEARLPEGTTASMAIPTISQRSLTSRAVTFFLHIVAPGVFILWGCVVVGVHVTAESKHSDADCELVLKPWFSAKPGCSLVELNCATLQSNGNDDAYDAAWDAFNPERAARIVVRHCPALYVSPKLRAYHKVSGFKLYNSTVVAWGADAALTETDHASLRSVMLLRTTLPNGEPPDGLLSPNFPRRMTNFYTATTNIQSLPPDLDTKWPKGLQLLFENSLLTEIPSVVIRLEPSVVSAAGSPISVIPTELIESPNLTVLQISLACVQELPTVVKRIHPAFNALFVQFTNMSVFPAYFNSFAAFMTHFPARLFNAYSTPYCHELDEIVAGTRKSFSTAVASADRLLMDVSTPEKLAFVLRAVDCTGPGLLFYYPLADEDLRHGLS